MYLSPMYNKNEKREWGGGREIEMESE